MVLLSLLFLSSRSQYPTKVGVSLHVLCGNDCLTDNLEKSVLGSEELVKSDITLVMLPHCRCALQMCAAVPCGSHVCGAGPKSTSQSLTEEENTNVKHYIVLPNSSVSGVQP